MIVNGITIDITGDQFKYYDEPLKNDVPVYVGPKTPYFELFDIHPCGRYITSGYNPNSPKGEELDAWYRVTLSYLAESD